MNVLCVAAHPDDEVLGCGATLARHAMAGDSVRVQILSSGATSRPDATAEDVGNLRRAALFAAGAIGSIVTLHTLPDQRFDSVSLLDIARLVESVLRESKPQVVYTHSLSDLNADHRRTSEAVRVACRPQPGCTVRRLLAFEVPSATGWGLSEFTPTVFVDVSGQPYERKRAALDHYAVEMRPAPHARSYEAVDAMGVWRGASVGLGRAEAFELVREIA